MDKTIDQVKDEVLAEVRSLKDSLDAEKRALAAEKATYTDKNPGMQRDVVSATSFRDLKDAMIEKRAFTVNGTGAYNVVSEIVQELSKKRILTSKYKYFYGPNASTIVPILSPGLATPAGQNEAATMTDDATGVLSAVSILPKAYVSILPVSAEALLLSGASIEASLPSMFADAFGRALYEGSLTGAGTGNIMTGMFVDSALTNNISCAAAGTPKLVDLVKLALTVQDYADDAYIVINPTLVAAMLAETTAETSGIKQEIMSMRSCMGVPLVFSGSAPSTVTASSIVAVAMPMSNYAVAMASEMYIEPIKVKGDISTYFQASMFFNGKPIVAKNGWQLITI